MHPDKYTNAEDSDRMLYPFMTGTGKDCYKSKDPFIKQYWGSGFATPGNSELSKSDAVSLVKKYLTDNYYWYVVRCNIFALYVKLILHRATNAKRV